MLSAIDGCCIYLTASQTVFFFLEANIMNPDQTATIGAVGSGFIFLQKRLPKNIGRRDEQATKVIHVTGRLGLINKSH